MKKFLIIIPLLCFAAVCFAMISGIDGKWVTTLSPGNGTSFEVTYTFKTDGDKFTGDVVFPGNNDFAITDGTIKGDSIKFFVTLNGKGVPNYGKVYADSIALDIEMNKVKHHHILTRAK